MRCLRQLRLAVLCAGLRILRDKANADKARVESAHFVGAGEEGLERLIHRFRSGSELFAAGIVALGQGQMDAARALGHGYFSAMRYVILPQALYNMIPSMLSTFVATIKDTTLGYVINVPDLDVAMQWAARFPDRPGVVVEVRPNLAHD